MIQNSAEADGRDIVITIYGSADGSFDLYEGEGTNYNYEKGRFSTIRFTWRDGQRELTIAKRQGRYPGMLEKRNFAVSLVLLGQAPRYTSVTYVGSSMAVHL